MPDVRLIDANAIVEKLQSYYDSLSPDVYSELIRRDEVSSCIAELINAHTIDAQPMKHGHWIETRRYRDADGCIVSDYSCSECGSVLREMNPDDRDSELYCYRCGAKMDGGAAVQWEVRCDV